MLTMSAEAARRIAEVLDEETTLNNPENPVYEIKDGSIDFTDVSFKYSKKAPSIRLEKLLRSAIANWEAKNPDSAKELDNGNVYVKTIMVDEGRTLKRIRPCPQGRAGRIRKRSNHVTVVLDVKKPTTVEA